MEQAKKKFKRQRNEIQEITNQEQETFNIRNLKKTIDCFKVFMK